MVTETACYGLVGFYKIGLKVSICQFSDLKSAPLKFNTKWVSFLFSLHRGRGSLVQSFTHNEASSLCALLPHYVLMPAERLLAVVILLLQLLHAAMQE